MKTTRRWCDVFVADFEIDVPEITEGDVRITVDAAQVATTDESYRAFFVTRPHLVPVFAQPPMSVLEVSTICSSSGRAHGRPRFQRRNSRTTNSSSHLNLLTRMSEPGTSRRSSRFRAGVGDGQAVPGSLGDQPHSSVPLPTANRQNHNKRRPRPSPAHGRPRSSILARPGRRPVEPPARRRQSPPS